MGIRLRRDGRLLCAAHSDPEEGDIHIDDRVHYYLVCSEIIVPVSEPLWKIVNVEEFRKVIGLEKEVDYELETR